MSANPRGGSRARARPVAITVVTALVFGLPLVAGGFWISLATAILVAALGALSLNFVFGYGGMLDIGHAFYFALAAYSVVIISRDTELPVIASLAGGLLLAGLGGLFVGWIVLRVGGFYLALATIAVGLISASVAQLLPITGGLVGATGSTRDLFGLGDLSVEGIYAIAFAFVAVTVGALWCFPRSRAGRALNATKNARMLAESVGVDTASLRLRVFVLGATLAGMAGALSAIELRFMSPDLAGLSLSLQMLIMTVIGGIGTAFGPVLGALVIRGLPEVFQDLLDYQTAAMGAFFLVVLLRFRGGVMSVVDSASRVVRKALFPSPVSKPRAHPKLDVRARSGSRAMPAGTQGRSAGDHHESTEATATARHEHGVVLEVRDLTKRFDGLVALDRLSLSINPRELHALVGPNGSGKTTAVNLITGFLQPTSGEILWRGRSIGTLKPHERARVGMMRTFQLVALSPELTVLDNVKLGAHTRASSGLLRGFAPPLVRKEEREIAQQADEVIQLLNLGQFADSYPSSLPGGPRRLTEVARCLMADPSLLLLDEPAAGLNEFEVAELAEVLRKVTSDGTAVLLIEHNMSLVMMVSDTVTVIDAGRIIAAGKPASTAGNPAVIEAYLGRKGRPGPQVQIP